MLCNIPGNKEANWLEKEKGGGGGGGVELTEEEQVSELWLSQHNSEGMQRAQWLQQHPDFNRWQDQLLLTLTLCDSEWVGDETLVRELELLLNVCVCVCVGGGGVQVCVCVWGGGMSVSVCGSGLYRKLGGGRVGGFLGSQF